MSISTRRLLLLSSSALVALCFAGAASSQTPPTPSDTPPTTTPPASEAPASQGPQAAPEAPQAAPQTEPSVSIPTVTVTAPPPRPRTGTARPAAPARVTTPPPPTPTPTATPSATTAGQPAATSPFNQPPASLSTITSSQIRQALPRASATCSSRFPAPRRPASPRGRRARSCAGSTTFASVCRRTVSAPWTSPILARIMACLSIRSRSRRSRSSAVRRHCATARRRWAAS